jgi:hypothetical protein
MNTKRNPSLDEVLADYAGASQEFDAEVLQAYIDRYPDYARALQRFAQVQLTSVPATPEEVDNEPVSDEEMLPRQSKLLQRMQQLRSGSNSADTKNAERKLASISGEKALQAAVVAVFASYEHGEDLLLLSVVDAKNEMKDVPQWFYEGLGSHLSISPADLQACILAKWRQSSSNSVQRFSSKEKPVDLYFITWVDAVEDCITDHLVKRSILERG